MHELCRRERGGVARRLGVVVVVGVVGWGEDAGFVAVDKVEVVLGELWVYMLVFLLSTLLYSLGIRQDVP